MYLVFLNSRKTLRRTCILFLFLIGYGTGPAVLFAQYSAPPVWMLGYHAGLDFNSGAPLPINSEMYSHSTRSATQCDAAGNVLFYSNGFRIWDKAGNELSGSANPLWPSFNSGKMGSIIVPDLSNPSRYYVFSNFPSDGNPPYGAVGTATLTYTLVDVTLNGGLGGIVPGQANIILNNSIADHMAVVPDDACGYWLIVTSGNVHVFGFKAYRITSAGISTAAVPSPFASMPSSLPAFPFGVDNRFGNMVYSYTRNKIFMSYSAGDLYAYDFNPATGAVTNPQQIGYCYSPVFPASASVPGICLSPDEQLLYTCGYTDGSTFELRQYPVQAAGPNITLGAHMVLFSPGALSPYSVIEQPLPILFWETDMQLGYDHKIYLTYTIGKTYLARINQPDLPGMACNYDPQAITLLPGTYTTAAMPAPMITRRNGTITGSSTTEIHRCFEPSVLLTAPDDTYLNYVWQDGTTGKEYTATISGIYILRSGNDNCETRIDTFKVILGNFNLDLGKDTLLCKGESIMLDVTTPGATYLWQDGNTDPVRRISEEGAYTVTVQQGDCRKTASKKVRVEVCNCEIGVPSAFSPNGDGKNDIFLPVVKPGCPTHSYSLSIYNRYGQRIFFSSKPESGWDGTFHGRHVDVGTYMYRVEYTGGTKESVIRKGDITLIY